MRENRIRDAITAHTDLWMTQDFDGSCPVNFEDQLAYAFYCVSLCKLVERFYNLGRKHERKKKKASTVARYNRRK